MNKDTTNTSGLTYSLGMWVVGFLAFAGVWLYAISEWGLLFGLLFGWIPAIIAGVLAGVLWPVCVILIIVSAVYFYQQGIDSTKRSYEYHSQKCMTTKGNEAVYHCKNATKYLQEHPDWKLDEAGRVLR